MKIVRIWLYKQYTRTREITFPAKTVEEETSVARGDFAYYEVDGDSVRASSRKEARAWSEKTGQKIETWRGYPAFMHDQGYRI